MIFFRSLVFNVAYVALTIIMLIIGLPVLLSERLTQAYVHLWCSLVLALLRIFCGVQSEVRGRERITSQPVIYACKHQSAWDVFMLLTLLPAPMFVLKRELLWIPMIGWYMRRYGIIPINRSKGADALKAMSAKARDALHAKRPLMIFPEGTRRVPNAPAAYQSGVALLYDRLKVGVVPIALNSGLFWGRNAFIKKPGTAVIEFLPAIPPGLPPREMLAALEAAIEGACDKMTG